LDIIISVTEKHKIQPISVEYFITFCVCIWRILTNRVTLIYFSVYDETDHTVIDEASASAAVINKEQVILTTPQMMMARLHAINQL